MKRAALAFALTVLSAAPALAQDALACIAPSEPADAGKPLHEVRSLEFYVDEGDPLTSFSQPFVLQASASDREGRTQNRYSVGAGASLGTIVFAGDTPQAFRVAVIGKLYDSATANDDETKSMADDVPGIACYTVTATNLTP